MPNIGSSQKPQRQTDGVRDRSHADNYLKRFGYINREFIDVNRAVEQQRFAVALAEFQAMAGVPATGTLDDATLRAMNRPRCGAPDRPHSPVLTPTIKANFVVAGSVWNRAIVTYQIEQYTSDLAQAIQDAVIATAFARWSAIVPMIFNPVTANADIRIRFEVGDHGDGAPFDSAGTPAGNVLAHAFSPPTSTASALAGDVHFDDFEMWQQGVGPGGIDLLTVAVHEIGHALGLDHTNVAHSVMSPFYPTPDTPGTDDRAGIRSVYREHIWVASLYRDLLGRRFDDQGLDEWVRQRMAGATTSAIAQGFVHSAEYCISMARELYFRLLDRAPDAGGLATWSDALAKGISRQEVIIGFLCSPEYLNNNTAPAGFVQSLYQRLLQRAPDPGGFLNWVNAMAAGMSPAQVAGGFLNSEEYCRAYSRGLYLRFLRREPEENGWRQWSDILRCGRSHQEVVTGFLASDEYRTSTVVWW